MEIQSEIIKLEDMIEKRKRQRKKARFAPRNRKVDLKNSRWFNELKRLANEAPLSKMDHGVYVLLRNKGFPVRRFKFGEKSYYYLKGQELEVLKKMYMTHAHQNKTGEVIRTLFGKGSWLHYKNGVNLRFDWLKTFNGGKNGKPKDQRNGKELDPIRIPEQFSFEFKDTKNI